MVEGTKVSVPYTGSQSPDAPGSQPVQQEVCTSEAVTQETSQEPTQEPTQAVPVQEATAEERPEPTTSVPDAGCDERPLFEGSATANMESAVVDEDSTGGIAEDSAHENCDDGSVGAGPKSTSAECDGTASGPSAAYVGDFCERVQGGPPCPACGTQPQFQDGWRGQG